MNEITNEDKRPRRRRTTRTRMTQMPRRVTGPEAEIVRPDTDSEPEQAFWLVKSAHSADKGTFSPRGERYKSERTHERTRRVRARVCPCVSRSLRGRGSFICRIHRTGKPQAKCVWTFGYSRVHRSGFARTRKQFRWCNWIFHHQVRMGSRWRVRANR